MRLVVMSVFHCNCGLTITFPNVVLPHFLESTLAQALKHNAQILRAIRAYLTEDNPEIFKVCRQGILKNFGLKF